MRRHIAAFVIAGILAGAVHAAESVRPGGPPPATIPPPPKVELPPLPADGSGIWRLHLEDCVPAVRVGGPTPLWIILEVDKGRVVRAAAAPVHQKEGQDNKDGIGAWGRVDAGKLTITRQRLAGSVSVSLYPMWRNTVHLKMRGGAPNREFLPWELKPATPERIEIDVTLDGHRGAGSWRRMQGAASTSRQKPPDKGAAVLWREPALALPESYDLEFLMPGAFGNLDQVHVPALRLRARMSRKGMMAATGWMELGQRQDDQQVAGIAWSKAELTDAEGRVRGRFEGAIPGRADARFALDVEGQRIGRNLFGLVTLRQGDHVLTTPWRGLMDCVSWSLPIMDKDLGANQHEPVWRGPAWSWRHDLGPDPQLAAAALEESSRPVLPGEPGKADFWTWRVLAKSQPPHQVSVIYPPCFDLEETPSAAATAAPANGQAITVDRDGSAHASVNNRDKPHENITGRHGQEGQYTKTITWSETIDGTNALLVVFLEVESVDPVTWHHLQYTPSGGRAIDLKEATGASHCQIEAPAGGMQTFIYYLPLGNVTKGRGTISIRLTFEKTGTANCASLVFYGVDQSNPIFSAANGGSKKDARTLSTTIAAGTGNKVIADIIGDNHAHTWEPNSGQTKQWELLMPRESKSSMAVGTLYVKDAGNKDIQWTASDTWGRVSHSLVVLNPVQKVPSAGPAGAAKYRFEIKSKGSPGKTFSFEADKPWRPLTPIWKDLPSGEHTHYTLTVTALDATGKELPGPMRMGVGNPVQQPGNWAGKPIEPYKPGRIVVETGPIAFTKRPCFAGPYSTRPARSWTQAALIIAAWAHSEGRGHHGMMGAGSLSRRGLMPGQWEDFNCYDFSAFWPELTLRALSEDAGRRLQAEQMIRFACESHRLHQRRYGGLFSLYGGFPPLAHWGGEQMLDAWLETGDPAWKERCLEFGRGLMKVQNANGTFQGIGAYKGQGMEYPQAPLPGPDTLGYWSYGLSTQRHKAQFGAADLLYTLGRLRRDLGTDEFLEAERLAYRWVMEVAVRERYFNLYVPHSHCMFWPQRQHSVSALWISRYLLECAPPEWRDVKLAEELARWAEDFRVGWGRAAEGPQQGPVTPRIDALDRGTNEPVGTNLLAAIVFERLGQETGNRLWTAKGEALATAVLVAMNPENGTINENLDTQNRSAVGFCNNWAPQLLREYAALKEAKK